MNRLFFYLRLVVATHMPILMICLMLMKIYLLLIIEINYGLKSAGKHQIALFQSPIFSY